MKDAAIIDSYARLPLGRYLDILTIKMQGDGTDYMVRVASVLTGLTEDAVLDLPLPDFKRICEAAHFLTEPLPLSDGKRIASSYDLGDLVLVPVTSAKKMTAAQYIDFQQLNDGEMASLPAVLSCILVPKGKRYCEDYDPADVRQAIADRLPVTDAEALSAFFLRRFQRSIAATLTSFHLALRMLPRKQRRTPEVKALTEEVKVLTDFWTSGAGLRTLTR